MAQGDRLRPDIELLRVVAAFAIVWFHAQVAGHDLAYGGLVTFLILSTFLADKSRARPGMFIVRVRRLLVPWAVWMVVYGAINLRHGRPFVPLGHGLLAGILSGAAIHLWYLPFVFFCLVVSDALRRRTSASVRSAVCGVAALVLLAGIDVWRGRSIAAGEPWMQYAQALPAILIGSFLGAREALRKELFFLIAGLVVVAELLALHDPGIGLPYVVGTFLLFGVALLPGNRLRLDWLGALAPLTFGIYLIHPIFLHLLEGLGAVPELLVPVGAFALSAAVIWALRRLLPRVAAYAA